MHEPEKIEIHQGRSVVITWDDGATTELEARTLREACRCADCRSDAGMAQKQAVLSGTQPITVEDAELRGAYAVNLVFGPDRHGTGIFTWDMLRALGDRGY